MAANETLLYALRRRLRLVRAVAGVVARVEQQSGRHSVSSAGIREQAWQIYRQEASAGSISRRLWHRSVGAILVKVILRYYRALAV